jgi:hypothetical protein
MDASRQRLTTMKRPDRNRRAAGQPDRYTQ